jgi:hypothetical protein
MTEGNKKPAVVKVLCANCGGEPRNHEVLREFSESWDDEENQEQGGTTYQICQCRGCERLRFRQESWSTYDRNPLTGESESTVTIYPDVLRSERQPIETIDLPDFVSSIYSETVVAFNAGALTLAGGGLRAIVEAICIEQKVSGKTLQNKIDDLVAKGLLAKPQADLLHEERYIGNAALHEILPPSKQEVEDGLAIVEGLMNTIYVLPLRAARLRKRRQGKKKP